MCGAEGGNRTHTPRGERDFESRASTSSTTSAHRKDLTLFGIVRQYATLFLHIFSCLNLIK
jgi:hypothetical protein